MIEDFRPPLMSRAVRRAKSIFARALDVVGLLVRDAALFIRIGPRAYGGFARTHRMSRRPPGKTFANGVTTTLTPGRAMGWYRAHRREVVVILYGRPRRDPTSWMNAAHKTLRCRFLVSPEVFLLVGDTAGLDIEVAGRDLKPAIDLVDVWEWMHRKHRRRDLVLLDAAEPLPAVAAIIEMQHAAYRYHHDEEIGFVTPAYRSRDRRITGFEYDRATRTIVAPTEETVRAYGQEQIPRYTLFGCPHGFYATSWAIDRVEVSTRHLQGLPLAEQVSVLVRRGWGNNVRTLCLSSTVLDVVDIPRPQLTDEVHEWVRDRRTVGSDGRTRIVFVLNATSISGGIRAVFEIANGLSDHGFDVEIWSLQKPPTWLDLRVRVRTYQSYEDLLLSLRSVDAIKVATWWETAEIVWLASASHGVPVYFIQEFETWFYPDDEAARAAVVASYRHEFVSVTQATFQQNELAEIGIRSELVPIGYDPGLFHEIPGVEREDGALLALGRSFFQKNFAMTVRAWRAMADARPRLLLFGFEPQIVVDPLVEYLDRPRDAEVNRLYNVATVFVQTSRHEGFCLPVLEAMAAGCPVITTDSHGNRDFCIDGVNCVVVAQDDDEELERRIRDLLDSPAERHRFRLAGLETARRYAWPTVIEHIARFYASVAFPIVALGEE